ncbi:hypothetical protein Sango_2374600 [Sesamum angolense]|uniref:Uncharacterized protein n=1 Tax=Sesamum angolense TaxID=2727404 RepID=A0AAE2BJH3_9LAMI|nr:hypothetical protein Sango_2374600 [Sesamum angolense]
MLEREVSVKGGKMVLIQSILQAIPSYALSCFRLSDSLICEVGRLFQNSGGVVRLIERFSGFLGGGCCLVTRPESLLNWVFKARYFPHSDFFAAHLGYKSFILSEEHYGFREVLKRGTKWRIGDGHSIRIWVDRCFLVSTLFKLFHLLGCCIRMLEFVLLCNLKVAVGMRNLFMKYSRRRTSRSC